ncbi:MAG: PEGA domain-containing protein [Pseudomonadota bacterium]
MLNTPNYFKIILVLPLLALATGCASITRGSNDALEVNSTPSQADVKVYRTNAGFNAKELKNNTVEDPTNPGMSPLIGKTPASFKLARKGEYRVVISKEGYKTAEVEVGNRLSGAGGAGMAGNAIFGGLVGVVVDASTGATKDLTPNPIDITLEVGEGTVLIPLPKSKADEDEQDEEVESEEAAAEMANETADTAEVPVAEENSEAGESESQSDEE